MQRREEVTLQVKRTTIIFAVYSDFIPSRDDRLVCDGLAFLLHDEDFPVGDGHHVEVVLPYDCKIMYNKLKRKNDVQFEDVEFKLFPTVIFRIVEEQHDAKINCTLDADL